MNRNLLLAIILIFSISGSFFVTFQYYAYTEAKAERDFYSETFDESKSKILLVGSSYVGMANATLIQSLIHNDFPDSQVFSLARDGDRPLLRLAETEKILSLEPKIVVFGISYRDFSSDHFIGNADKILPDAGIATDDFLRELDIKFLKNPKFNTLSVLRNFANIEPPKFEKYDTPFFTFTYVQLKTNPSLITDEQIGNVWIKQLPPKETNPQYHALSEMIDTFQKNNIKVIVYIVPYNYSTLNLLSEEDKKNFNGIISALESKHNLKIDSLLTKYSEMDVWASFDHVTTGEKGLIYNFDIANMIINSRNE